MKRFDRLQQRHRALALPLAVVRKFGNDQGGNLASLIAYKAFFSLFPLLLVFVTVLGYVLQGHPSDLRSVEDSVKANFPVVGKYLQFTSLHGHLFPLIFGIVTSVWSGLGVTNAAQNALDTVWAVPFKERPDFIFSRLRGLGLLGSLGLLFLISTAASGLVTGGLGGPLAKAGGITVSFLANIVLFFAAFRFMTAKTVATRCLRPGVLLAALFWTILQAVGGAYVGHALKHLPPAYASFGFVIGLLVWLHLGAQMTLYAAEVNVVVQRHLWPRSLLGPPVEEADQRTLAALAKVEERHPEESVEVRFDAEPTEAPERPGPAQAPASSGQTEAPEPSAAAPQLRTGDRSPGA